MVRRASKPTVTIEPKKVEQTTIPWLPNKSKDSEPDSLKGKKWKFQEKEPAQEIEGPPPVHCGEISLSSVLFNVIKLTLGWLWTPILIDVLVKFMPLQSLYNFMENI